MLPILLLYKPVAVFLASDATGNYSISNRSARSMLRISDVPGSDEVLSADAHRHYEVMSNGRVILPTELPIARAAATGGSARHPFVQRIDGAEQGRVPVEAVGVLVAGHHLVGGARRPLLGRRDDFKKNN